LLSVDVRATPTSGLATIEAWIDTGFTGELVLPEHAIRSLDLEHSGSVDAVLADGSQIELNTYTCFVHWIDGERRLEVVANQGNYPLLGVGLLLGLELRLNYQTRSLTIDVP
jgi:clan AA aspartic protease